MSSTPNKRKRSSERETYTSSTSSLPGSSSNPITIVDTPVKKRPAKRARKTADSPPETEKRGAMFKKRCPQNIMDRVDRVMTQRFFMIDRKRNGKELREEFSVLGSTGNVYTVVIDKIPSCSCPDATKGNHCKHIVILQVNQDSGLWYQKALLTSELEQIFANARVAPNSVANSRIREAYARAIGKSLASASSSSQGKKRIPGPDDDCPICYETMSGVAEKGLTFCDECGNALHNECFLQWRDSASRSGKILTCVWCRAKWTTGVVASGSGRATTIPEGYINLSGVAGCSPIRDTSTYYYGPRRGSRPYGDPLGYD